MYSDCSPRGRLARDRSSRSLFLVQLVTFYMINIYFISYIFTNLFTVHFSLTCILSGKIKELGFITIAASLMF